MTEEFFKQLLYFISFTLNFNMANLLNFKLPEKIVVLYSNLYWLSVKLHKLSSGMVLLKSVYI